MGKKYDKDLQTDKLQNILVFSLGGIGDKLLLFPAIKNLRIAFPRARIYILTDPNSKNLFELLPLTSFKLLTIDIKNNHKTLLSKIKLLNSIKNTLPIDLLFNAHRGQGVLEHTLMSYLIGAPYRIGFTQRGTGFLYTNKVEFDQSKFILRQNISLLNAAKLDCIDDSSIDLEIGDRDMIFARNFLKNHYALPSDTIIAVHPGADWIPRLKCWPLEKYAVLIRQISIRFKAKILLLGDHKEKKLSKVLSEQNPDQPIINAVGKTSISQLAALLSCTNLFVGNDSGPLHLALALNIPSVAIFGATSPKQLISTNQDKCLVVQKNIPCRPCYLHQPFFEPRCKNPECLSLISVSEVLDAVKTTLSANSTKESIL